MLSLAECPSGCAGELWSSGASPEKTKKFGTVDHFTTFRREHPGCHTQNDSRLRCFSENLEDVDLTEEDPEINICHFWACALKIRPLLINQMRSPRLTHLFHPPE